jgi:hypothetical protein
VSGRFLRAPRAFAGVATAVLLGALSAGCTVSTPMPSLVSNAPRGTVAFESIDGLPEGQFRRLVQSLAQEAEQRQLAIVSRAETAQYRVRGYAAAHIRGKRTTISWVWDIYDADRQRTLRIYGEERGSAGQRGWAAADDATLDRIAKDGMAQLAGFLGSPAGSPPPAPIPADGPAVAALEAAQPQPGVTTHAALADGRR